LLLIQKEDIENLINSQKSAIKIYTFYAITIFLFGISLLVFANLFAPNDTTRLVINIGGTFISSLTTFPIKEIINRNDKIGTYHVLKRHVIFISEKGEEITQTEKQQILDLIMEIIKKTSLSN
jgi:low affinity Fe/Cu permease